LGVNLHVCLCGDLQVASAQTLDFLDIGQKSSFPDWKLGSTGKSFPDGNEIDSIRKWSFLQSSRQSARLLVRWSTSRPLRKQLISSVSTKPGPAAKRWD
ncbi:hypothetical protein, partial [Desulfatiglans anilini]|uniref:hypothetical protein n=1 Tax=Desulfatiglans anilini TaxID=90728 RepID=UPI001ABF2DF4